LAAKKIGIYGGTFDPIHNGHVKVIAQLLSRGVVDQIILVPAGEPLLRESAPVASGADRLEMCKLAIAELKNVIVSDIEIKRTGPSYAIDTVTEISGKNSGAEIFWIIGSDAYEKIDSWHRANELKELVNFIVVDRPGYSDGMDIDAIAISATEIRDKKDLSSVPFAVRNYISEKKLYAS
jgi:nicotinate-nucleotide adenylyltransferase